MQPGRRRRRPIARSLRPDAPLRYETFSDPILVRRARDGDRHALAALCERHAPRVERLARHLLADPEDARDAAQDALAKLCQKLPQFRGESAFTTWLQRLAVNACRDAAGRRLAWTRRTSRLDDDLRASPEPGPARCAELSELRAALRVSLAELPAQQARVLVLKDALGLSYEDVAAAAGMPVGTAKCYAHRGRAGMRLLLDEDAGAAA